MFSSSQTGPLRTYSLISVLWVQSHALDRTVSTPASSTTEQDNDHSNNNKSKEQNASDETTKLRGVEWWELLMGHVHLGRIGIHMEIIEGVEWLGMHSECHNRYLSHVNRSD